MLVQYATSAGRKRTTDDVESGNEPADQAGGAGDAEDDEPGSGKGDERKKRRRTDDADSSHLQQVMDARNGMSGEKMPVYRCYYCARNSGDSAGDVFAQLMAAYAAQTNALTGRPDEFAAASTRLLETLPAKLSSDASHEEIVQHCRRVVTALQAVAAGIAISSRGVQDGARSALREAALRCVDRTVSIACRRMKESFE